MTPERSGGLRCAIQIKRDRTSVSKVGAGELDSEESRGGLGAGGGGGGGGGRRPSPVDWAAGRLECAPAWRAVGYVRGFEHIYCTERFGICGHASVARQATACLSLPPLSSADTEIRESLNSRDFKFEGFEWLRRPSQVGGTEERPGSASLIRVEGRATAAGFPAHPRPSGPDPPCRARIRASARPSSESGMLTSVPGQDPSTARDRKLTRNIRPTGMLLARRSARRSGPGPAAAPSLSPRVTI